ncbi:phospholipase D-like domain-containing protein [Aureispira anguillae]|uniref:phospholipase D n=1 Tax=Aureispira anguillae TaxID=2864201 RepID=A0A916DUG3_9BACT|nr:phospholipase D-like domain-containing protein [Aureispira anguillae]BDS13326.1 phospholipase D-like domain-containing protein [Aureispira anguillae]
MNKFLLLLMVVPTLLFSQETIQNVEQVEIQKNSFTLAWSTTLQGQGGVQYGTSPDLELGIQLEMPKNNQEHQVRLNNLKPATFYYARPLLINEQDTVWGATACYTTQSNSTGVIRVMFNQGIDPLYSNGNSPHIVSGGANIENEIIAMINQATSTIDIAVYNNTRSAIVAALTTAHNNGIRVRYIANSGSMTSNAALSNPSPPFPVFYANSSDLMHNKFMIIDANTVNSSWVWTGSCNWTYTDMYTNYNNSIAIQDQALAQAYVMEFDEMWGSSTANYNASNSKVGAQKADNTPHNFNIGGKTIEAYFSPSDHTTDEIESGLYSADHNIEFCILSYTRNELGTAIRNEHQSGVFEHGIMENINDIGSEFPWLQGQGVNILADNHATDLHHKYAIVDAEHVNSDPLVITGSHNWTTAAEERNDENTLIIHDADIANLYLQEFTLRWCEVKNNVNCTLPFTVYSAVDDLKVETSGLEVYPNPIAHQFTLEFDAITKKNLEAKLYTATGQQIIHYQLKGGQITYALNLGEVANGLYFLVVQEDKQTWRLPISIAQ